MKPGCYADAKEPTKGAYFDGSAWEPSKDRASRPLSIQETLSKLPSGHPGPTGRPEVPAAAVPRKGKAGLGWLLGVAAGAILIIWGIVHGYTPAGRNCGAPFKESSVSEYMDAIAQDSGLGRTTYAADCRDNIASATVWVWVLILIGVLLILASAIIMAIFRAAHASRAAIPAAQPMPTTASQIEELARLRDNGLVTPEEFEWKKHDLLRRS